MALICFPNVGVCEETEKGQSKVEQRSREAEFPIDTGSFHIFGNVGYVPPFIDMDYYDGGGLAFNLGMGRIVYKRLFAFVRAKYQMLLLLKNLG